MNLIAFGFAELSLLGVAASGFFCAWRSARPLKWLALDAHYAQVEIDSLNAAAEPMEPGSFGLRASLLRSAIDSVKFHVRLRAFTWSAAPAALLGSCLAPFGLLSPLGSPGLVALLQVGCSLLAIGPALLQLLLTREPSVHDSVMRRGSYLRADRAHTLLQAGHDPDPLDGLIFESHRLAAARALGLEISVGMRSPRARARAPRRL